MGGMTRSEEEMMKTTEKLQRDVVNELAWDPAVDSSEISVTVTGDGIVTLKGEVPSYWQKRATERSVKRVAGVRAVANDLEVRLLKEHRRDDTDLAEAAVQSLKWHSSVPRDRVRVTVSEGWVTLEGKVRWEFQRRAAYKAVRNLLGVRGVSNLIEIEAAPRPEDIREKIDAAFHRSAGLDADRIRVEVEDGVVTLRGDVSTWRELDEAEWVAWSARGVTDVKNELDVRAPAFAS